MNPAPNPDAPNPKDNAPLPRRLLGRRGGWTLAAAALVGFLYLSWGHSLPDPERVGEFLDRWRHDAAIAPYLPLLYMGIVVILAASSFPRAIVVLAATAVFGPLYATLYTSVGGVFGASAAFLAARYVAQDFIQKRLPGSWREWEERLSRNGFVTMLVFRSIPFAPMSTPHYAAGLSRMSFAAFAAGTFLGFIVSTIFYVFFSGVVIALYKRAFDVPYMLQGLIALQAAFIWAGYALYRRESKRRARTPVLAPPPEE